jgi:hypothetical protein
MSLYHYYKFVPLQNINLHLLFVSNLPEIQHQTEQMERTKNVTTQYCRLAQRYPTLKPLS